MKKNLNGNRSKDSPPSLQHEVHTWSRKWYHSHSVNPKEMPFPKMPLRCQAVDKWLSIKIPQSDSNPARSARAWQEDWAENSVFRKVFWHDTWHSKVIDLQELKVTPERQCAWVCLLPVVQFRWTSFSTTGASTTLEMNPSFCRMGLKKKAKYANHKRQNKSAQWLSCTVASASTEEAPIYSCVREGDLLKADVKNKDEVQNKC